MCTAQRDDKLNQLLRGYADARTTLAGLASYEEHQLAREWLASTNGQIARAAAERVSLMTGKCSGRECEGAVQ